MVVNMAIRLVLIFAHCSKNTSLLFKHVILHSDLEKIRFRNMHTCSRNTSILSISLKSIEAARGMSVDMGVVTCTRAQEIRQFSLSLQLYTPKAPSKS